MGSASRSDNKGAPLWQFVTPDAYSLPAASVAQAARSRFDLLRNLLWDDSKESTDLVKSKDELVALPPWRIERIAPALDWGEAADALHDELADWLAPDGNDEPIVVLVGPPYGGHTEILTALAEKQGWPLLKPPSPAQILGDDEAWLWAQSERAPWVLPRLERTYLRHVAGLNLIRRGLSRALSGELGRGVIGCDSWAWSFLGHVWRGRQPVTLTLQAFDQARLRTLFRGLAASMDRQIQFRQADDGSHILSPSDEDKEAAEASDFLQMLAAYSRGIVGIAWHIWRAAMRAEPGDSIEGQAPSKNGPPDPDRTVWVTPWDQIDHPSLPSDAGRDDAFVLHTLLLHDGLPPEWLERLLPLSPSQTVETISRLREAGLVTTGDQGARVSPHAYPAVRRFLAAEGYLVDQF